MPGVVCFIVARNKHVVNQVGSFWVFFFSSPELKAQVSYSGRLLSFVRL
jgi:hypothetical protein